MSVNLLNANNKLVEENTKKTTVQNEQSIIPYLQSYEKRMNEYMDSIPHIPPTQFELKVRHGDVKNEIIKQFKNAVTDDTKSLASKQLENQIEKIFQNLSKKNMEEYKTCQCAFTIGWKCNVNKSHSKQQPTDDRF